MPCDEFRRSLLSTDMEVKNLADIYDLPPLEWDSTRKSKNLARDSRGTLSVATDALRRRSPRSNQAERRGGASSVNDRGGIGS